MSREQQVRLALGLAVTNILLVLLVPFDPISWLKEPFPWQILVIVGIDVLWASRSKWERLGERASMVLASALFIASAVLLFLNERQIVSELLGGYSGFLSALPGKFACAEVVLYAYLSKLHAARV